MTLTNVPSKINDCHHPCNTLLNPPLHSLVNFKISRQFMCYPLDTEIWTSVLPFCPLPENSSNGCFPQNLHMLSADSGITSQ